MFTLPSNPRLHQAKQSRDQAYLNFQKWNFTVDILENYNKYFNSPVGLTYPFPKDIELLAIPVNQGEIDTRSDREKQEEGTITSYGDVISYQRKIIPINIQPDPISLIKSLNIDFLPNPVTIMMTFAGPINGDGYLTNYKICNEEGQLNIWGQENLNSERITIPKSILDEIAKQIGPKIDRDKLKTHGDNHALYGYYNFNWSVYLIIPSKSRDSDDDD